MFEQYNPIEDKLFQIIDNDGKVINKKFAPEISNDAVLKAYKDMLFARTADLMVLSYQRQGRIYTYPPNYGQEAIAGAAAMLIRDNDWVVPAFREMGVYLSKGASLKELFLYFMGYEDGSRFKGANRMLPISVPIASQLLHASGLGYSVNYNKEDSLVYTFVGDGGTSEGDFHEALNFAGVWKAPVIFIVQNNQYGISTPWRAQTASLNLAVKSVAYGIKGIKVDGNDLFAMYAAIKEAGIHCKNGNGPVLIEALTYRKGPHTTSDDPTKYRTKEEEEKWECTDPLKRVKKWLIAKKLWDDQMESEIIEQFKKEVDRQFVEAENYGPYKLNDVFDYMFVEKTDILKSQQAEYENFLKWKEGKK